MLQNILVGGSISEATLSVIIVNYDARRLLKNCIEFIYDETHDMASVSLVIN